MTQSLYHPDRSRARRGEAKEFQTHFETHFGGKLFHGFHGGADLHKSFTVHFGTLSASEHASASFADSSRPLCEHAAPHRMSAAGYPTPGFTLGVGLIFGSHHEHGDSIRQQLGIAEAEQAREKAMTMISPEAKALMLGVGAQVQGASLVIA